MLVGELLVRKGGIGRKGVLVIKSLPPNDDMGDNGNADARHCKRYVTTKIARIPLRRKIRARSTVYRPPPGRPGVRGATPGHRKPSRRGLTPNAPSDQPLLGRRDDAQTTASPEDGPNPAKAANVERDAEMGSAPVLDAQRVAEMEEELATLRQSDAQAQRNLRVMQRHLSEERARVAELHARLIGRSGSSAQCEREMIEAAIASRVQAEGELEGGVEGSEGPLLSCPAHAHAAKAKSLEEVSERSTAIADKVSKLRQESFKEEPMALAALKELAMDSVQEGVTIADFSLPDQPLIYANHGFELITGYSIEETVGHNCRFLQGPDTEPEKLAHIRRCINAGDAQSS